MSLGLLDEVADDEVEASALLGFGRLREALEELKKRGIKIKASWLPILLAILAAIPDLMEAIQRFIDAIKKPTPTV